MIVFAHSPEVALATWQASALTRQWIAEGLEHEHALCSVEDIERGIARGGMRLWDVFDENDAHVASFLTEVVSGSKGKAVHLIALGGVRMESWLASVSKAVADYAREIGARYVVEMGRPGWKRVLAEHGWVEGPVVMLKVA